MRISNHVGCAILGIALSSCTVGDTPDEPGALDELGPVSQQYRVDGGVSLSVVGGQYNQSGSSVTSGNETWYYRLRNNNTNPATTHPVFVAIGSGAGATHTIRAIIRWSVNCSGWSMAPEVRVFLAPNAPNDAITYAPDCPPNTPLTSASVVIDQVHYE